MHSVTNLPPQGPNTFSGPGVLKLGFEIGSPQATVTHLLVHAWRFQQSIGAHETPDGRIYQSWMGEYLLLSRDEIETLPKSADTKSVHTPWRDMVYHTWNHVFTDVGTYMRIWYNTKFYNPPNVETFALEFPQTHETSAGLAVSVETKVWEHDTLLASAYLAPGVSLRAEVVRPDQQHPEPSNPLVFDHERRYSVWYVKKGHELRFFVEGNRSQSADALAAVMVYGGIVDEQTDDGCASCLHTISDCCRPIIEYV